MIKRLSFIFVCLLLLSLLGEAFHHHDDCTEHSDCPICMAVIHHKSDTGFTYASSEIQRELTETIYQSPVLAGLSKIIFIPELGRSPPA
ncbi:MAG: hypothetical protein ABSA06_11865 [Geobacteraceae bacterium]